MVILSYNHAFTLKQLEVIITQYLELGPYNQCLISVIKSYMNRYSTLSLQQRHHQQHEHPIKLPINFYKYSTRQSSLIDKDEYSGQYEYIYPLSVLIQIMNCAEFYNSLPKNIIINHLLTTTNISIIIETLTILSQEMSKLVKTTLDSVQDKKVTKYISTLISGCLDTYQNKGESKNVIEMNQNSQKQLHFIGLLLEKGLNQDKKQLYHNKNSLKNLNTQSQIQTIRIDSDFQLSKNGPNHDQDKKFTRKVSRKQSIIANLLKKQDLSQQDPKSVVKNLKTLFIEDQMLRPLWLIDQENDDNQSNNGSERFSSQLLELQKAIARKPKQFRQCEYCRNYRSYLIESTGLSYFDLLQISRVPSELYKVLRKIKNVVNAFTLYLKQTNRITIPANINVVNKILASIELVITEDLWQNDILNPSIKKKSNDYPKQSKKTYKLINQMQPYFNQVYNYKSHDSSQFTIDELLRICLKASQMKAVQKTLIDKYMNQARLKKEGKDIQTFCITKQNLQKKNHLQNNFIITDTPLNANKNSNFQSVLDEIQLIREYEKQQTIINRAVINSKPIYAQINKKYQDQITMGTQIKRHKNQSNGISQKKELQKSLIIKEVDKNSQARENEKFKMIMYQQFMRNQGFNVTKSNINAIINQNMSKGSKNTNLILKDMQNSVDFQLKDRQDNFVQFNASKIVRNSANTFSGGQLKSEQEGNTSYEKKQTQLYNKMLLNGEVIRNQVLNEVQYGQAVVYESMEDFLRKLEELNAQVQEQQVKSQTQDKPEIENLFLTMCGSNLRKTTPGMKKSPKNQDSLRNSKKTNPLNANKTPKSNFQTKFSSLSNTNTKGVKFSTKDKLNLLHSQANNKQFEMKKSSSQKNQVSINQIPFQGWSQNVQIKKPDWLNQFVTNNGSQKNEILKTKKSQDLLQNQRFRNFQEKCLLKECLSGQKLNFQKTDKQRKNNFGKINSEKRQIKDSKTMTNLKRPISAFRQSPKNSMGTIKSLGRTLSGKRRSFLLSKQFEVENNSLLTKIFKQNIQNSPILNVKKEIHQQRVFQDFKKKIEKGKFTVDKFLS